MVFSISKLIVAVVVAFVVGLVLTALIGPIIAGLGAPITKTVGDFFINWGWPLGIVAGVFYYFGGPAWTGRAP